MQTFMPYPSIIESLRCLDFRRLGKQRVEAFQLITILLPKMFPDKPESKAWHNHPASLMWKGYETCLIYYYNVSLKIWEERGGHNIKLKEMPLDCCVDPPKWIGDERFHASHRSNLLRKDREFYGQYGWKESDDLPYVWPVMKIKGSIVKFGGLSEN